MKRIIWQVWTEVTDNKGRILEEKVLFEGSKTNATKFFKKNGGYKAGLHLGYSLTQFE